MQNNQPLTKTLVEYKDNFIVLIRSSSPKGAIIHPSHQEHYNKLESAYIVHMLILGFMHLKVL